MTNNSSEIKFEDKLQNELINKSNKYYNVSQEIIITTEDKLRIHLMEYSQEQRTKTGWISPASFFLTLLIILTTATFRDFILPSATWHALFILLTIGSVIWLIVSIVRSVKSKIGLNDIVSRLKNESEQYKA